MNNNHPYRESTFKDPPNRAQQSREKFETAKILISESFYQECLQRIDEEVEKVQSTVEVSHSSRTVAELAKGRLEKDGYIVSGPTGRLSAGDGQARYFLIIGLPA